MKKVKEFPFTKKGKWFFLSLLMLQFLIVYNSPYEPYPAILMPSFGFIPQGEPQPLEVYLDGQKTSLKDAFPDLPPLYTKHLLDRMIKGEKSFLINISRYEIEGILWYRDQYFQEYFRERGIRTVTIRKGAKQRTFDL